LIDTQSSNDLCLTDGADIQIQGIQIYSNAEVSIRVTYIYVMVIHSENVC